MNAGAVLRSLPRRPAIAQAEFRLPVSERVNPRASLRRVVARGLRWVVVGAITVGRLASDHARGKRSVRDQAVRLRQAFELLGGPAIKLGQQLAIRVDLLPFEVCDELSRLMDKVPPFPWEAARAVIEAELGQPPERLFARVSERPIGSASIACVWKATLESGEEVAVKVQRPDVAAQFAADLAAFDAMTRTMEALTLVRPGFFANMRSELRGMFIEELDFRMEARYQTLYRRAARRDGMDWIVVPKVFRALSATRVITSEFVAAIPMTEVLRATDGQDADGLAALAAQDIHPSLLGERILVLSNWGRFEAPLFHADPHPANLLVMPGSRVVLLDFGACGVTSRKTARNNEEILRRMAQDEDIPGVAAVALYDLAPLPHVGYDALYRETEEKFMDFFIAARNSHAEWWERTSAGLWLKMLEVSQRFQIGLNLDTLRMMRSTLLYDSLAFRINGEIGIGVSRRYLRDAIRRRERRQRREGGPTPADVLARTLVELPDRFGRISERLAAFGEQVSITFQLGTSLLTGLTLGAIRLTRGAMALAFCAFAWFLARGLAPVPMAAAEREMVELARDSRGVLGLLSLAVVLLVGAWLARLWRRFERALPRRGAVAPRDKGPR